MIHFQGIPNYATNRKIKSFIRYSSLFILLYAIFLFSFSLSQTLTQSEDTGGYFLPEKGMRFPLHIEHADYLVYFDTVTSVYAKGNVVLSYGEDTLKANEVWYLVYEKKFYATGSVVFYHREAPGQPVRVMRSEEMIYELDSEKGYVYKSHTHIPPMFIEAPTMEQINKQKQRLYDATFTTCNLTEPHYHFRAREITVYPNQEIIAKDVTLFIGKVPIMYFPYYRRSLKKNTPNFDVEFGNSSRTGTFIKTFYQYPITQAVDVRLRMDYHSKEGFGEGIGFTYDLGQTAKGSLDTFYIDEHSTDLERYRISFRHRSQLTDTLTFSAYADYASDNAIDQDYFHTSKRGKLDTRDYYVALDQWDSNYNIRLIAREIDQWVDDTTQKANGSYKLQEAALPKIEGMYKYQKIDSIPLYYSVQGSFGEIQKFTGLTTASNQTTFTSFDAQVEQDITYATKINNNLSLLASGAFINSYEEKTSYHDNANDFDTYLQERLRLQSRITRNLKADLFYTLEEQADSMSEDAPSSLVTHNIGGRLTYRVPNSSAIIRWRGEYSLLPQDDIRVGDRQYFTRLDIGWYPNKKLSYGLSGVAARGLQNDTTYGNYFKQSQSIWTQVKYQPRDWYWVQLAAYYSADQTPGYISGNSDTLYVYPSFSTRLGTKWHLDGSVTINTNTGKLEEKQIGLYRDLHCWEAYLLFHQTPTDSSFHFVIKLKAFSRPVFPVDEKSPLD